MIIDLQRFFVSERRHWAELESLLERLESDADFRLNLEQARHFHYLYERTSADLAKITTFASEPFRSLRSHPGQAIRVCQSMGVIFRGPPATPKISVEKQRSSLKYL